MAINHRTHVLENLNGAIRMPTAGARSIHVAAINQGGVGATINLVARFSNMISGAPFQFTISNVLIGAGNGQPLVPLLREAPQASAHYMPDILEIQTTGPLDVFVSFVY